MAALEALRLVSLNQTPRTVKAHLHAAFTVGSVDPRLYGGLIEHVGRAIYSGIYEPGHASANGEGFREDVLALVRELGMPIQRYPGGNFVSSYAWEDGVGPREARPARLDLAWRALEPNEVGTDEFVAWCRKAGTQPYIAVNLGTRGPAEAQALVEYCNHPGGTELSDRRRQNARLIGDEVGAEHGVKLWCLGNEMDGSWQACAKSASEYGRIACEAAKLMKRTDPSIELVVCGSSGSWMSTFGAWEEEVLQLTYPHVDYISLHAYYANKAGDTGAYLRRLDDFAAAIRAVAATIDHVAAKREAASGGGRASREKPVHIAIDEWNSWWGNTEPMRKPKQREDDASSSEWSVGRELLEEVYGMEDALLVGGMLIVMLNHADRVRIACLAQTVNAIAPIMTRKGGGAWRQATYWPFHFTSKYGRGLALRPSIEGAKSDGGMHHPFLVMAAVLSSGKDELRVFVVNRHLREAVTLELAVAGIVLAPSGAAEGSAPAVEGEVLEWVELRHDDLSAVNTEDEPERVQPIRRTGARVCLGGSAVHAKLAPASWNMLRVGVRTASVDLA